MNNNNNNIPNNRLELFLEKISLIILDELKKKQSNDQYQVA